ncbi:MAG: glutamate--tRNA ligase [Planctomycetes bacterium]|nr:glutamate--tRNA ligase [Planctomycetota bacterium]
MSQTNPTIVRTRFAPSPSGPLHVGGARTALFCWAYAKAHGGSFILRIEDTDQKRSSDAACQALMHDLRWLGIDWDEGPEFDGIGGGDFGPYFCSKRLDIYHKYIDQLLDEGKAYRAFETPQDLDAARNDAKRQKHNYRYDRSALKLDQATIQAYLDEGRPYVVRFKLPNDEPILVRDEVRGEVTVDPKEMDDFVILKADGYPTYHFAVVVDDELMDITHVIRGQEHLNNTAKHVLLQDALGFRRPVFAHLSLIFNPDGSKMSKRDKDKALRSAVREENIQSSPTPTISDETWQWWSQSKDHQLDLDDTVALADALNLVLPEIDVDDFRRAGYLPQVLVNYLALLGWSPGNDVEKFDRAFLIEHFDLDRIIKSHAKFDRDKLLAFNLDAIQAMSPKQFRDLWYAHCREYHPKFVEELSPEQFDMLAAANQSRSKTLDDTVKSSQFFIMADDAIEYEQTKAVRKALCNGDPSGYDHLAAIKPLLADLTDWTKDAIEPVVDKYSKEHANGKLGKVAQPLRIAVSGSTVSPAIFETLAILGREAVVNRITRCLANRQQFLDTSNA